MTCTLKWTSCFGIHYYLFCTIHVLKFQINMQKTLFLASIAVMLVMAHSAKNEAAARKLIQAKIGSMGATGRSKVAHGFSARTFGGIQPFGTRSPFCQTNLWKCFGGFQGCNKMCQIVNGNCNSTCWNFFMRCVAVAMSRCSF